MRKTYLLFLALTLMLTAFGQRFPKPFDPPQLINDFAQVISDGAEATLEQKLLNYSDTTSTEIAVVTLKTIGDEDPNLYAAELGEEWGVGRKGKDNGLVFLIAVDDRVVAIQNGYGLEEKLTDAQTKLIIENEVLPAFREGNYAKGIDQGTTAIFRLLEGTYTGKPNRRAKDEKVPKFFILLVVLIIIFVISRAKKGGGGIGGSRGGGGYWIGGTGGHWGGGGFGGGSSGGFGGGGFGGFGGGSFGGGGASGSW